MSHGISVNAGTREYVLGNGLKVLIKENHSAPLCTCQLWFGVGAADEPEGLWGAAHLTEHMLFRSTERFPAGAVTSRLRSIGGTENAATSHDYTYYHVTLPAEQLDFALESMSQRFYALFLPEELEKELQVVLSELEGGEDNPARELYRLMVSHAFTENAYWRPVIGTRFSLENMSRDALVGFYRRFYVPSAAVLVIVGDISEGNALKLAEKYFAGIAGGPAPQRISLPEPVQKGMIKCVLESATDSQMVEMGYHIPDIHHPDAEALSLLGYILSYGVTGRLYESLVETGFASEVWASPNSRRQPYLFNIGAEAKPGVTSDELAEKLLREIEAVKGESVSEEALAAAIRQTRADIIYDNSSVTEQGETLGYSAILGDWREYDESFDRLFKVTPADIARVAETYLVKSNLTMAVTGSGDSRLCEIPPITRVDYSQLRDKPLLSSAADALMPETLVLPNGMRVVIRENHSGASVAVSGHFMGGSAYELPCEKTHTSLMVQMLLRGTSFSDAVQLNGRLEQVGAELDFSRSPELIKLSGRCLSEDTEQLFSVMQEALKYSEFPQTELEKLKQEALAELIYNRAVPGYAAASIFYNSVVPKGDPRWGCLPEEAEKLIRDCTGEKLRRIYQRFVRPDNFTLVICGDITFSRASELINRYFGDWKNPSDPIPAGPTVLTDSLEGFARKTHPMPGRSEVYVMFGYPVAINKLQPEFAAACLANHILGGGTIGSRLGQLIREESGLVYGIGSSFSGYFLNNLWSCAFGTHPERAEEAISLMLSALEDFGKGNVTKEELEQARSHIIGRDMRMLSVNQGMCAALETAVLRGLGLDFPWRIGEYYSAPDMDEVNEMCRRLFSSREGLLVCAGKIL